MSSVKTIKNSLDSLTVTKPKYQGKSNFSQCRVTHDGKPLKLKLHGNMFMLPMKNEHEDYGISFKAGIEFNEDDMVVFEDIIEKMYDQANDGDYVVKQPHEDGSIFMKLPTNKALSEFTFESNVPIKPGRLDHDKLEQHMAVTVDLLVSGWYLNDKSADVKKLGVTMKIRKIHFGQEKSTKKRKVGDDEVDK